MKTKLILAFFALFAVRAVSAQGVLPTSGPEGKGECIIQIFTNFHSAFGAGNDDRGFELERSYLGYRYRLPGNIELRSVVDVGQSSDVSDHQRIAYLKNAMLTWQSGALRLSGGLIPTTQFALQEKFWGYRYLMRSFQDANKFGSSADLGVSAAYDFSPAVSADLLVVNGEGYRMLQVNDGLLYGAGLTLRPLRGLTLRAYGSWNEPSEDGEKGVATLAAFAGYEGRCFSVGAEYNASLNSQNRSHTDQYGASFYAKARLSPRFSLFGRCDRLDSEAGWNKSKDGTLLLAGVEWKLGKYVRLSPNARLWLPEAGNLSNGYSAFVSCFFGL